MFWEYHMFKSFILSAFTKRMTIGTPVPSVRHPKETRNLTNSNKYLITVGNIVTIDSYKLKQLTHFSINSHPWENDIDWKIRRNCERISFTHWPLKRLVLEIKCCRRDALPIWKLAEVNLPRANIADS